MACKDLLSSTFLPPLSLLIGNTFYEFYTVYSYRIFIDMGGQKVRVKTNRSQ